MIEQPHTVGDRVELLDFAVDPDEGKITGTIVRSRKAPRRRFWNVDVQIDGSSEIRGSISSLWQLRADAGS